MATLVQKPWFFGELFFGNFQKKAFVYRERGTNSPKQNLQGEILYSKTIIKKMLKEKKMLLLTMPKI
jgi:hypothetical protein